MSFFFNLKRLKMNFYVFEVRLQKGFDPNLQNFSYRRLLCVSFPTFFTGKYFLRILLANLSIFFSQCNFHWLPLAASLKQPHCKYVQGKSNSKSCNFGIICALVDYTNYSFKVLILLSLD